MPKITVIELDAKARQALEEGYNHGPSATFGKRCQIILLKSQGRTSGEIGQIVGCCEMSVHNWVHRYQEEGMAGLHTKPGRGRPAILQECDKEVVLATVQEHRQRLSVAKAALQDRLGKSFCRQTLTTFVKKTAESSSVSVSARDASRSRKFMTSKSKA